VEAIFMSLEMSDVQKLNILEEENSRLKGMYGEGALTGLKLG